MQEYLSLHSSFNTAKSFVYAESGLSPNLTSRFTSGTLIPSCEVFEALRRGVAQGQEVRRRYIDELGEADVRELAIHRSVSRLNYSRRCAEASAVQGSN